MTLYEIDQAILACIDEESGEIIDADALAELSMERDKKVEGVALWIKNLRADAPAPAPNFQTLDDDDIPF